MCKIPIMFYSEKSSDKFKECKICTENLLQDGINYVIEKAYEKNILSGKTELIYEYAICYDCIEQVIKSYSKKSITNINNFFINSIDLERRNYDLSGNENVEDWISTCVISGKKIENLDNYQISAMCVGENIIFSHFPMMISGDVMEEVQELISEETRNIMDGLKELLLPPTVGNRVPIFM